MNPEIFTQPLTKDSFAPFGEILDASGSPDRLINAGKCGRHHDLATLDFGQDGQAGIPGTPLAFITHPYQGVNFRRGTWHGVLTPLAEPGLFAVFDRIGTTTNLDEYPLDPPYVIKG